MKKYLITSTRYTGTIQLTYNVAGLIQVLDFTQANLPPHWRAAFKQMCPSNSADIPATFGTENAKHFTVVETTYEIPFEEFWEAYDEKINKKRCIPIWEKMKIPDKIKAMTNIPFYDKYIRQRKIGKLNPENYLRTAFENDYEQLLKKLDLGR